METLYRKVIINSPTDLPKEEGIYYMIKYNKNYAGLISEEIFNNEFKEIWMDVVDWYLLPIDEEQEEKKTSWGDFTMREPEIPMKEMKSAALILGNYVREYNESDSNHAMFLTVGKTECIISAMHEYASQFKQK